MGQASLGPKKKEYTVLFFTHFLNAGGAEKVVRRLVGYINSHDFGMKARECVIFDDPDYHDEVPEPIVLKSRSKPGDPKAVRAFNVFRQILELRAVKKEIGADICISFLPGADIINVLSPVGEKRIVSVRNKESFFVHNAFRKKYVRYAYDHCDRVICVSEVVRRDVIDFFGAPASKTQAILNAIEEKRDGKNAFITPISDEHRAFMDGSRIIVTAGRLNDQKGQDHLIRSFAHLISRGGYDDCKLMIMGKGELLEDLKNLAGKLGIVDRVLFTGSIHGPEEYLKASTVFVLSSYIEGIPNVILEAMQCGLPCISTECGSRELLAPDTDCLAATDTVDTAEYGILIPICKEHSSIVDTEITDDEILMADAIAKMLDDDKLRTGYINKGFECIEHYTPDRIFGQWIDAIKDTLEV